MHWEVEGLRKPSVVRAGHIPTLTRDRLGHQFGRVSERDLSSLNAALRLVLDLPEKA
jgi:mRNA-degrading endonuclease toxin of MazEF toxin-antitoxin module